MKRWVIIRIDDRVRLLRGNTLSKRMTQVSPSEVFWYDDRIPDTGFGVGNDSGTNQLAYAILLDYFGGTAHPEAEDAMRWVTDNTHDNFTMFSADLLRRLHLRNGESVEVLETEIRAWLQGWRSFDRPVFRALGGPGA